MKKTILFAAALLVGFCVTGCRTTGPKFDPHATALTNLTSVSLTNEFNSDWLKQSDEFFKLGPGDVLDVEIIGEPTSRSSPIVGPDGKIYYYLLPGLNVWGMTLPQARSLLENELAKYVGTPQVAVSLKISNSKRIWMLGRFSKPGLYSMGGPMTVLEAVALAGGTSRSSTAVSSDEFADLRHAFLVRQGKFIPVDFHKLLVDGDMSQNIYLQPDDFIYVPSSSAQEVYVLGSVNQPRAIPYRDQLTLLGAIATAYGPVKESYASHVLIVRGSLTEPKVAVVDYPAIMKGNAPDVLLEPHDIVYVPFSPFSVLDRYVTSMLNTFVGTVAANEGSRFASPNATVIGVSSPVGTGGGFPGAGASGGSSSGGSTPSQ
ncbi:MAG TPA: polysaccharide biosynthesis/export family protein [Verrucomicrobiae bacterium]|jgi:protein involved in polysaccharide export with SLBB domain|nr:polysaccharide biosynthesis/export family protein [Verrucomicrobiae bacterium]